MFEVGYHYGAAKAVRQAGRQAVRQAGCQAGRLSGRQAVRQAGTTQNIILEYTDIHGKL